MKKVYLLFLIIIPLLTGCAEKFNPSDLGDTGNNNNFSGDTVYVALNPSWEGFNNPQAILIGNEPFIYVCDTDNDRIVMMNTDGQILSIKSVKKPIAIAQDYRLNLIVCAQFDTTINGVSNTYGAVYKIDLYSGGHDFSKAPVTRILPREYDNTRRQYTAVTVFYDNSYLVARTGPDNSSIYDPDNSILKFQPIDQNRDSLIGRLPGIDPISSGLISANGINCLTAFKKKNFDFIATFSGESAFKSQWFNFFSNIAAEGYQSKFDPEDKIKFVRPNRFGQPMGSCIDPFGNIFIADAAQDSILKFDASGEELHSFGGSTVFTKPSGVAYFDKTLYVLDAGKNKILRFILSTDLR